MGIKRKAVVKNVAKAQEGSGEDGFRGGFDGNMRQNQEEKKSKERNKTATRKARYSNEGKGKVANTPKPVMGKGSGFDTPEYTDHVRKRKDKARKKILAARKTAFYDGST